MATATKSTTARVSRSKAAPAVTVDPDVYVAPTGLSDGFQSTGQGPKLDRLSARGLENLTELAEEGNTEESRKYWTRVLSQYGVTLNK